MLVGTDIPLDPGDHRIVASAAGYQDWTKTISVAAPGEIAIDIPVLDKQVVEPPKPVVHEGTLKITTVANAEILLDSQRVATGSYEAKLKSGGHTLRVIAGGMRPYQSEIVVGDDETRTIDVPLEKEPEAVVIKQVIAAPPAEDIAELRGGRHARRRREAARRQAAAHGRAARDRVPAWPPHELRPVRRVRSDRQEQRVRLRHARRHADRPLDFGPRNQFTNCSYVMPGLQLCVHVLPRSQIDPYIGLAPGFRFGFVDYVPYIGGVAQMSQHEMFPAIVANVHVGVDYRPRGPKDHWQVGGYVQAAVTIIGDEAAKNAGYDNNNACDVPQPARRSAHEPHMVKHLVSITSSVPRLR